MHVATSPYRPEREAWPQGSLRNAYHAVRRQTRALIEPLSDADATVQSMTDASPAKWHLAHTTWFFETFLLRDHLAGYRLYDGRWPFLFNSYYETEGARHPRCARGLLTRPMLDEVRSWCRHVDEAMEPLLDREELAPLLQLGMAHEQQHQELLLTDIKHAFWGNPLGPAYRAPECRDPSRRASNGREGSLPPHDGAQEKAQGWLAHPGGIIRAGYDGSGFAFDNEGPCHRVLIEAFALADRLVTNAEWQAFIDDGGYATPALWLSDGWDWLQRERVTAPLYWRDDDDGPCQFSHYGWVPRKPGDPVLHISYYEAEAFAHWAGCRLPTEFEWEALARTDDHLGGEQLDHGDGGTLLPGMSAGLFGSAWQWTQSAYLPYPRFAPAQGAIGEYNGKFMCGQFVLRGASCATPRGSSRATYRNFFYPHQRWQFTSLRLARNA